MTWEISHALERTPAEAITARHLLDRADGSLSADRLDDARLIVSELVTNAIQHGKDGASVGFVARWNGRTLRLEVRSLGPFQQPSERPNGRLRVGGWGLRLVEALADRWGIETGKETIVWAEVGDGPPTGLS